jgi:chromosome segregation ATPase
MVTIKTASELERIKRQLRILEARVENLEARLDGEAGRANMPQEQIEVSQKPSRGESPREQLAAIIEELERMRDRLCVLVKEAFNLITPEIDPLKQVHQMYGGCLCVTFHNFVADLKKVMQSWVSR